MREFAIANSRNSRAVRVVTDGVPYLGVWSKPGGAPFVCVEPWHGIPDMSDASGELAEKEGIIRFPPRESSKPDTAWKSFNFCLDKCQNSFQTQLIG